MSQLVRALVPAALLALLTVGCGSTSVSFEDSDRSEIAASSDAWRMAAAKRDTKSLGTLYTRDAVLLPPNARPVRGRAAIEDFFSAYPEFKDLKVVRLELEGAGDLAYVWGSYSMSVMVPELGSAVPERGKFIEIWRKQSDGTWRIDRDIYSSDLPASQGI